MPFGAVLDQVGGLGRFQVFQTALLAVPILFMASHNLLQNFTAAVPPHRCRLSAGGTTADTPRTPPNVSAPPEGISGAPEGISAPSGGISAPSGGILVPSEGISAASEDISAASEGISAAFEGISAPSEGISAASEVSAPSEGISAPSEGISAASEGISAPSEGISAPSEVSAPSEGISAASEGISAPSEGISAPSEVSAPSEGISAPSEGISAASEGPLRSSNAIVRSPEGHLVSPGATSRSPGVTFGFLDGNVTGEGPPGSPSGPRGGISISVSSNGSLGWADGPLGSCRRYVAQSSGNGTGGPRATEPCQDGWDYDLSVYVATIVNEWDLVCGRRQLRQMAQSLYMAGVLLGALVLGGLSDRFGRKALLLWSYAQLGLMGTCTAFAPNYALYCLFRFMGGMALSGFGLSIACLVVEWIPTPYRAVTVAITGFAYTLGQILLAAIAYAVPHWRWLQLTVSLPFFVFLLSSWWLAESARWLVLSGKAERAVKVLQRVAKVNKKKEEGEKLTVEILKANMKEELAGLKASYSVSDLVRTPVIRHIFLCLSIVWFSISFSYYGLAMDLQNFGVSIYLIQVIFGAVDFPAKVVVTISISYIGRRVSLMVTLFLAGLVIITNIFVSTELQTVRTALAVIGKGCLSAAFNCVFLFTTELYPTPIRQTGLGFGSTMARVGGIVAPLVKMMEEYYPFLPPAVYGVAPVVAAVVAAFLPETLNKPLPDTIEEVENRVKQQKVDLKEKIPLQPQDGAPQKDT
ncbi:solute carrier family 22 member 6-A [Cuculus canorus]|nr:solute carrier family 22 member 6-A [Cuculus canorus]